LIAVAQSGSSLLDELAALTACLCHQTASWDNQTGHPTPRPLASASDKDHPAILPKTNDENPTTGSDRDGQVSVTFLRCDLISGFVGRY
jgi:hypothetical protein